MPRSKNRVLDIEKNGEYVRVQFVRDDGQIAIGEYKRFGWARPPKEIAAEFNAVLSRPPIARYSASKARRSGT